MWFTLEDGYEVHINLSDLEYELDKRYPNHKIGYYELFVKSTPEQDAIITECAQIVMDKYSKTNIIRQI
jgi:hypothetical protein